MPMNTAPSTTTRPRTAPKDAIALLRADHTEVNSLFADYAKTRSASKKKSLVAQICAALIAHAQIEEEIFYPAVKEALHNKLLVPEATVEHASLKNLISQLEASEPDDELYDAKVKVLSEYVKHHVREEQTVMFPKVKASALDLVELGGRLAIRKEELLEHAASA